MASRLQDVILRGTSGARPAANTVAPGTLYYSTDTATTDRSDGVNWQTYADTGGGAASVTVTKLAAPFVVEPEEPPYELLVPGQQGQQGVRGPAGAPVPYVVEQEEYIYEPPIPIAGPAGAAGAPGPAGGGITQLTGDVTAGPGSGSQVATLAANNKIRQLGITIGDGTNVITTGAKESIQIPFNCTITEWTILSIDGLITSGSIVIDIWKDTYANFPPTIADTITASAKPTVTTTTKATSSALTGWTTSITAGDILRFNVDSVASFTKVILTLKVSV